MFNIFQNNSLIKDAIAKALGYEIGQKYSWFTEDIYFQTFFYLSKRFGIPSLYDDYKEAGAWSFRTKGYIIDVRMNSHWVEFMVYGKIGHENTRSPYTVKYLRESLKKSELLLDLFGDWNEANKKIADQLFDVFLAENNIDTEMDQEKFDNDYGMKWFEKIEEYNNSIININHEAISKSYGESYQNSYTRHALKTLTQFLNNMLTPIWIRDVAYNIKGRMNDEDIDFYERFRNNIKIEFIVNKKNK